MIKEKTVLRILKLLDTPLIITIIVLWNQGFLSAPAGVLTVYAHSLLLTFFLESSLDDKEEEIRNLKRNAKIN